MNEQNNKQKGAPSTGRPFFIVNLTPVLFEVPRAVPTIGLRLRLRRRVPDNAIERGQDGDGECQHRGDKDYSFCQATTLTTASASAQTPIHSASTAIVPKVTRPMPVIASLIGASLDLCSSTRMY